MLLFGWREVLLTKSCGQFGLAKDILSQSGIDIKTDVACHTGRMRMDDIGERGGEIYKLFVKKVHEDTAYGLLKEVYFSHC